MVAFGVGGATPKQRMTQVAAGLGLFENCVIDQHFEQRNRYGRLLMIVAQNPQLLGLGVDEDTAAVVRRTPEGTTLRVLGRGAVTILDPADLVTNAYEAKRSQPILASGVRLHVLPAGASFDLENRVLLRSDIPADDQDPDELAVANADLRRLTRDIAAEGKSPAVFRRRLARRQKGSTR
jgi:cyanophycinase